VIGFNRPVGAFLSLEKTGSDIEILKEHKGKYNTLKKKG
jgi:hypothetical protein